MGLSGDVQLCREGAAGHAAMPSISVAERESSRGEGPGIPLNNDTICYYYKTLRLTVNEFCVARSEGWLTSVAETALCTHHTVHFICSLGLQEESLSESLCICVGPGVRGKWCMALLELARTHLAKLFLCLASWVGCIHGSLPVHITAPRGWVQESTWPASSAWKYGGEQTNMVPCFCYPPLTVLTLFYIYFHSAHTLERCPSCTEMARYDIPHKVLEVHPDFYCRNKSIWPKNRFLKFVLINLNWSGHMWLVATMLDPRGLRPQEAFWRCDILWPLPLSRQSKQKPTCCLN